MMIQISTVNMRSDPSDYWDEDFFRTVEFEDNTMGKEREVCIAFTESVEECMDTVDYDSFIVDTNPQLMYNHPNADVRVEIYDGYNE